MIVFVKFTASFEKYFCLLQHEIIMPLEEYSSLKEVSR